MAGNEDKSPISKVDDDLSRSSGFCEALSIGSDTDAKSDVDLKSETDAKSDDLKSNETGLEFNGLLDEKLSKEILLEEKRLAKARRTKRMIEQKELQREQAYKELVERRYEGLLGLLEKSKFYSDYALKKLETSEQALQSHKNKKKKTKKTFFGVSESEDLVSAAKRVKKEENVSTALDIEDEGTRVTDLGVEVPESQPQLLTGACLRKYQMEGLKWMRTLYLSGLNGILADEMGLGKTVQAIALICSLYETHNGGPFVIIAPLSTLPNWLREFEQFAPDIPVVLYHGNSETRKERARDVAKKYTICGNLAKPVVLTSYEVPVRDGQFFHKYIWKYIIVDEGHRLKNHNSMLSRRLRQIVSVNRLLLTGTPLQNDLYELWSLLHFLLPDMFQNLEDFSIWFQAEDTIDAENVVEKEKNRNILSKLHEIIAPFMLRRVKADVEINLPPKKELHILCPLTKMQYAMYSWVVNLALRQKENNEKEELIDTKLVKRLCVLAKGDQKKFAEVLKAREKEKEDEVFEYGEEKFDLRLKMAGPFMVLRKISNHTLLVEAKDGLPLTPERVLRSGKMMILDTLLEKLKQGNHKVLLFSCFTTMLDIIEELMDLRKYKYERLDGSSNIEERKESIKVFNTDPSVFVFLLSTRAGGLGINVPAADTVIFYDSDWNPQADIQAQDRCHRIGQTKPVIVYRLVSMGTIDERIVCRAESKRKLEKCIIGARKFGYNRVTETKFLDLQFLKQLLEEKQHDSEIKANGQFISKEQWDVLLDRNF